MFSCWGVLLCLCIGFGLCCGDLINISQLSVSQAHDMSAVNMTELTSDTMLREHASYSGYISVDPSLTQSRDVNYFFWFFEALNSSASSDQIPFIVWLQGGPGCSSLLGLFYENGPFTVAQNSEVPLDQQLLTNPNAWNNEFHMIFVDNPVGSGFSYGDVEAWITNETQMAMYLENVLAQFVTKFPEYQTNPFFVFGESYAGKFIPALCSYIQQKQPASLLNLKGFGIGDGYTDPYTQISAHADMVFNAGLADEQQTEQIRLAQDSARAYILEEKWVEAYNARQEMFSLIEDASGGVNIYDYRTYTPYDYTDIINYVNQEDVREIIHVGNHTFSSMCNSNVKYVMLEDNMQSVANLIPALLDQYPALFYQGQFDCRDGVAMVEAMLRSLDWAGIPNYLAAPRYVWTVNGNVAGMTRTYENLNQCVVVGAGHLVPMNQGAAALEMVKRFVYNLSWNENK